MQRAPTGEQAEPAPAPRRVGRLAQLWFAALALLMLGPALSTGFALSYDMVFVPDQSVSAASLGATDAPPRAVPVDTVVAVLDDVVPGVVLHKLALLAILVLAGAGAARLVAARGRAAEVVAGTVYIWNPYVGERLALGHWSLLAGYAALPWLVAAALDLRRGIGRRAAAALVLAGAAAALTPTGTCLAALVTAPVLAWPGADRRARRVGLAGVGWLALAAPWVVAGAVSGPWLHDTGAVPVSVRVFASHADGSLGLPVTLVGLGGVWNSDVVPASRQIAAGLLGLAWTALVLALVCFGARGARRVLGPPAAGGLTVAAAVGAVLALLGATPGVRDVLVAVLRRLPELGLLRDGQKWLAPWALLLAVCAGVGAARVAEWVRARDRELVAVVPVGTVVLLLALLPDLAYGVGGKVRAAHYPTGWSHVRTLLDSQAGPGSVLVLPYEEFRAFRFTGGRTVLDPAPRYLDRATVTSDRLRVGGLTLAGESALSRDAGRALADPDPVARVVALRSLGVGWVLIERDQPGAVPALAGGTVAYSDADLRLLRLPGQPASRPSPRTAPVVAAHLVACVLVLAAIGVRLSAWFPRRMRRRPGSVSSPAPEGTDPA